MINRGGRVMDVGYVGKLRVLRSDMTMPGETIKARISGKVIMETLRERDVTRINAHIATYWSPIRWLDANWPSYVKAGPAGSVSLTYVTDANALHWGLGGNILYTYPAFYPVAVQNIYNNYYKWPEDANLTYSQILANGFKTVNLEHSWTRCRDQRAPTAAADQNVTVASNAFSVQQLAEVQARFMTAQDIEVLNFDKYINLLRDIFDADGSREVDKVPILVDDAQLGVSPRQLVAVDGASLGTFASVYDFDVDFNYNFAFPEHGVLTTVLLVRFAPITEERNPLANNTLSWAEMTGAPDILATMQPVPVNATEVVDIGSGGDYLLGYQAAGWQWRSQWNRIASEIDIRDSFPYLRVPTSAIQARDATNRISAFRSSSLGDYRADLDFSLISYSPIRDARQSFYSGMQSGDKKDLYPGFRSALR